jgi:hypothetical protein
MGVPLSASGRRRKYGAFNLFGMRQSAGCLGCLAVCLFAPCVIIGVLGGCSSQTASTGRDTTAATTTTTATTPSHQGSVDAKQWQAKWLAEHEAKAVTLSKRIGEIEDRIAEREATYKRRMEAGGLDGATRKEIDDLKQELDDALRELYAVEEAIAAGPPPDQPDKQPSKGEQVQPAAQPRAAVSQPSTTARTVRVRGYTRKDGTVVAPHTRSVPRR